MKHKAQKNKCQTIAMKGRKEKKERRRKKKKKKKEGKKEKKNFKSKKKEGERTKQEWTMNTRKLKACNMKKKPMQEEEKMIQAPFYLSI